MSIAPLDWNMDNTNKQRVMHEHVGKHAKRMHRKPNWWHKANMASNTTWGEERVCIEQTGITGMHLTGGYTLISHKGDGCNHIRTSPQGAQSMAKPRSKRQA